MGLLCAGGGADSSEMGAPSQVDVPSASAALAIARQMFAIVMGSVCVCVFSEQLWKLREFQVWKTLDNHFFSIENIWGIAQSGALEKYTDYGQAELMFAEETWLFLMALDFTVTEKRPFVDQRICTNFSKWLWGSYDVVGQILTVSYILGVLLL